jgi:hypothetical protein
MNFSGDLKGKTMKMANLSAKFKLPLSVTNRTRLAALALVGLTLIQVPQAGAYSESGHMTFYSYALADFGMRAGPAMRLGQKNQEVDNSIATMAFLLSVGEIHFPIPTAKELGTVKEVEGFLGSLETLKDRVFTRGTTITDGARAYWRFDQQLARGNFMQGAARSLHGPLDLVAAHTGTTSDGHKQGWTRPDELNEGRLRQMSKHLAGLTILYALLDHDNVLYTPEAKKKILGDFNPDFGALQDSIARLETLTKKLNAEGREKLSEIESTLVLKEITYLSWNMKTQFRDPINRIDAEFWQRPRNQKIIAKLPVRGNKEYFMEFLLPEIRERAMAEGAMENHFEGLFFDKLVDQRFEFHKKRLDPEERKKLFPNDHNSSAIDERDLVPAYVTKDLVQVAMSAELLRDMLVDLNLIDPKKVHSLKDISPSDPNYEVIQRIVQKIDKELTARRFRDKGGAELPFAGISNIIDFNPIRMRVFTNGFGRTDQKSEKAKFGDAIRSKVHDLAPSLVAEPEFNKGEYMKTSALTYFLHHSRMRATSGLVDPNHEINASRWREISADFGGLKVTNVDAAADLVAETYTRHMVPEFNEPKRTQGQVAMLEIVQDITKNLAARLVPMPESFGVIAQTFSTKKSDQYVVAFENATILEAFFELKGFVFKYSWSLTAEMKQRLSEIWKRFKRREITKETGQQPHIDSIGEPSWLQMKVLWMKKAYQYPLVEADKTVVVGPEGMVEYLKGWAHGFDQVVRAMWGFRKTPRAQTDFGVKGGIGNDVAGYAEAVKKGWDLLGRHTLYTEREQKKDNARLIKLNRRATRGNSDVEGSALDRALKDGRPGPCILILK